MPQEIQGNGRRREPRAGVPPIWQPERWLVIGPNRAGNFLELVVLTTAEGEQLVIHAMPLRPKYRRLLEP